MAQYKEEDRGRVRRDFTEPDDLADVVLVVEGQELYTSRYMLALVSPLFREMLSTKTLAQTELPYRLTMTEVTVDAVKDMLAWIESPFRMDINAPAGSDFSNNDSIITGCSDKLGKATELGNEQSKTEVVEDDGNKGVEVNNIQEKGKKTSKEESLEYWERRIHLAERYKITKLFTDTEFQIIYKFQNSPASVSVRLPYLLLAEKYQLNDLMKLTIKYFSTVLTNVLESSADYGRISLETLCAILKQRAELLEKKTDEVILRVENHDILASRSILAKSSPVFNSMFEADTWAEANKAIVPLPGKSHRAISFMVQYLEGQLNSTVTVLNDDILTGVLRVAHEYLLDNMKNECQKYMLKKMQEVKDVHTWIWFYNMSKKYDIPEVNKRIRDQLTIKGAEMPVPRFNSGFGAFGNG